VLTGQNPRFATREQLRREVFEYIETDYNRIRRHSTLGYISPEAFEARNVAKRRVHMSRVESYFGIQEFRKLFRDLDGWIRSRLRSTQLKKWKKPRKFQRAMIAAGLDPPHARRTWVKMNRWQSVMRPSMRFGMNLEWFRQRGVVFLNDFTAVCP